MKELRIPFEAAAASKVKAADQGAAAKTQR
jgi:hypothetical protein